jgi:transketolase
MFNSRPRLGNPDAKEDKHTAVLTIDDLQRLREQCGINGARPETEFEMEQKQKERLELMTKSRQRVKNWPNTIENLRKARIEEKYKRLEDEELERRRLDE